MEGSTQRQISKELNVDKKIVARVQKRLGINQSNRKTDSAIHLAINTLLGEEGIFTVKACKYRLIIESLPFYIKLKKSPRELAVIMDVTLTEIHQLLKIPSEAWKDYCSDKQFIHYIDYKYGKSFGDRWRAKMSYHEDVSKAEVPALIQKESDRVWTRRGGR